MTYPTAISQVKRFHAPISLVRGQAFDKTFTWYQDGAPVDLTGYTAVFSIYAGLSDRDGNVLLTSFSGTFPSPRSSGDVSFHLSSASVEALFAAFAYFKGHYHLVLTKAAVDYTLIKGPIRLLSALDGTADTVTVASDDWVATSVTDKIYFLIGPPGLAGSAIDAYTEKSAAYYADFSVDKRIGVNAASGNTPLYLPVAIPANKGKTLIIQKLDSTAYEVHVESQLGQPIGSYGSLFIISYEEDTYEFTSTGSGYTVT